MIRKISRLILILTGTIVAAVICYVLNAPFDVASIMRYFRHKVFLSGEMDSANELFVSSNHREMI